MGVEVGDTHELLLGLFGEGHGNTEVLDEVKELACCGLEIVLLDRVAHVVNDHNFELALHLRNGELLVHTLLLGRQQNLRHVDVQEDMRQSLKPA